VDVIITPTTTGEYYLCDREYNHLVNNEQFPGGMMTRLNEAHELFAVKKIIDLTSKGRADSLIPSLFGR